MNGLAGARRRSRSPEATLLIAALARSVAVFGVALIAGTHVWGTALAVMVSFVIPAVALLPTCAPLIVACRG